MTFRRTSLLSETPLAAISKREVCGHAPPDDVSNPAQVVYSVVPSARRSGYRTRATRTARLTVVELDVVLHSEVEISLASRIEDSGSLLTQSIMLPTALSMARYPPPDHAFGSNQGATAVHVSQLMSDSFAIELLTSMSDDVLAGWQLRAQLASERLEPSLGGTG